MMKFGKLALLAPALTISTALVTVGCEQPEETVVTPTETTDVDPVVTPGVDPVTPAPVVVDE